jgi:6-phosphogluconolactonase
VTLPQPAVRVFPDLDSLSRAAADLIVTLAQRASAGPRRFSMALSGGSTPRTLYALLASPPWKESLPWEGTHVFWADERCVSPDDRDSNYRLAFETVLSRVPLPLANIHRIPGEEGPDRAARTYEDELRFFFGGVVASFDLILLGAGEDGHTASLFPGAPTLAEPARLALPVHLDQPLHSRVTLTLPVLNAADHVLVLAAGRAKAPVVQEIIDNGNRKGYPAGLVRPASGSLLWMLDRDAASLLGKQQPDGR